MKEQERSRLGVLIIGRKRPGFDQQWNEIMRAECMKRLDAMGFQAIGAETPVVDDQTIAVALEEISNSHCKALLVLQPSLGNGQLALTR